MSPGRTHTNGTTGHLPRSDHGSISACLGLGTATDHPGLLYPPAPPPARQDPRALSRAQEGAGSCLNPAAPGSLLGVQTVQPEAPIPLSPSGPAALGRESHRGRGDAAGSEHPAEPCGAAGKEKVEKLRGAGPEPRRTEVIAPSPGCDGNGAPRFSTGSGAIAATARETPSPGPPRHLPGTL